MDIKVDLNGPPKKREKTLTDIYDKIILTGQRIDSVIAAPLTAISKANAAMLSGQTSFLLDFCFKKTKKKLKDSDKEETVYTPIMIKMRGGASDGGDFTFGIPLITLLPIGNLCVESVKLAFDLEVTSTTVHEGTKNNEADSNVLNSKSYLGVRYTSSRKNKEASKDNNRSNHMAMKIKVKQIPLPIGLNNLIDIFSKNIATEDKENKND